MARAKNRPVQLPQGDPAAIAERFKDFPAIELLSRTMLDPRDPGSLPILLKDEPVDSCTNSDHMYRLKPGAVKCHLCKQPARKWYVRWGNYAQEGRASQLRAKAYVAVEIGELMNADDVADLYRSEKDRHVRRGDRGQEILVKRPLEAHNYIKAQQRAAWNARLTSKGKMKDDLAEEAGREMGDEAGQFIHDGGIKIERASRSRTTLGEEAADRDA